MPSRTRSSPISRGATTTRRATGSASSSIRITIAARRTSSRSTRPASSRIATGSTTPIATTAGTRYGTCTSSRDRDGWLAEFRIPFSQLRFTPGPTATFGFAVVREIGRLKETSTWPLLPRARDRICLVVRRPGWAVDIGVAQAARVVALHGVRPHAAADQRQPAVEGVGVRGHAGTRSEVRPHQRAHVHGDGRIPISDRWKPIPPSSICRRSRPSSTSAGRSSSRGPGTSTSTSTTATCSTRGESDDRRRARAICPAATRSTSIHRRRRRFSAPGR